MAAAYCPGLMATQGTAESEQREGIFKNLF